MHQKAYKGSLALALPGLLGGAFAILIGGLVLLFSLPSLGRAGHYGYLISPAAGAVLYILLGFLGLAGAAWKARIGRARMLTDAVSLLAVAGCIALALFQEWAACIAVIGIAAFARAAVRANRGTVLLPLAGVLGFPLGQAAMTFLPYGWKTWAVSGTLMIFGFILQAEEERLSGLPYLSHQKRSTRRRAGLLYSLAVFLLLFSVVAALIHVPTEDSLIAGNGSNSSSSNQWCFESGKDGANLSDCDCQGKNATMDGKDLICQNETPWAKIVSPEDVASHPRGASIAFEAASCGTGPLSYIWESSLDGLIGASERFDTANLSPGWHSITLRVLNASGTVASDRIELGIAEPWVCGNVTPRPRYYPVDTPCRDIWPKGSPQCQQFEVCHPGLDYIVADAVDCCDGTAIEGDACSYACQNANGDKKRCRGLYIIKAFGPEARYLKGYALFKACCSGYPECTRTCGLDLAGSCAFSEGFNTNVSRLSCRPQEWGLDAWRSDDNMSQNSASLGILPAHATVNILQTGVCADYAAAVVTALRKAGYSEEEALYTASTGYDLPLLGNHPGHAYGLVKLPDEEKYHFVDTTGNGEGINLNGLPRYFRFTGCFLGQPVNIRVFDWWIGYCNRTWEWSFNDAGYFRSPEWLSRAGCSG